MTESFPADLIRQLGAADADHRESAWKQLIDGHSDVLLRVARSLGGGHDVALDRFTYILERLREDGFRRVRAYRPDRGASFPTWLAVIGRRLCLDHHRHLFGRDRTTDPNSPARILRAARRRLILGLFDPLDHPKAASVASEAPVEDRTGDLQPILDGLPPEDRLLLQLRFEQDLPAPRIAVIMGLPTGFHVYRRLRTVLGGLRLQLEALGIDSP